jgi:hypothetical protein
MVMLTPTNPPFQLPTFIKPEVAFQDDQDKAFHELTNGQVPKDE